MKKVEVLTLSDLKKALEQVYRRVPLDCEQSFCLRDVLARNGVPFSLARLEASAERYQHSDQEAEFFLYFLHSQWNAGVLCFYVKLRRAVRQRGSAKAFSFERFALKAEVWSDLATQAFASYYKPTVCIQRLGARLKDSVQVSQVPSLIFIRACVHEYLHLHNCGHNTAKPPGLLIDEELLHASTANSPPPKGPPQYYDPFPQWKETEDQLNSQIHNLKDDLQQVKDARSSVKEELEVALAKCDRVSSEHDKLWVKNQQLKTFVSIVADKLMDLNASLINGVDFNDLVDDPCKDVTLTGILEEEPLQTAEAVTEYNPELEGLLSLSPGDSVKVIAELNQWVYAERTDHKGFVPAHTLRKK